jgi:uncharacterized protein YecE (DUF72 family)
VVSRFCSRLHELADESGLARGVRHAFEFRDRRWFSPDVLALLSRHGHGLVIADPAPEGQSRDLTSDFAYLRFHHGPRSSGAYEEEELDRYAESTAVWLDRGVDVYAYFNNDPGGWAPRNAAMFRDAVTSRIPAPA